MTALPVNFSRWRKRRWQKNEQSGKDIMAKMTSAENIELFLQQGLAAFEAGDYVKSAERLQNAAKQGNADAQYKLGRMYEQGQGVPQDYMEAAVWINMAAKQGHSEAKKWSGKVESAFDTLANLAKQHMTKQMEELIGQMVTTQEGKKYLAVSMREAGNKYLYLMVTVKEPLEMIVGDVQRKDKKFSMGKYTGSDYDEILNDFMNNALNDLQTIKIRLQMNGGDARVTDTVGYE